MTAQSAPPVPLTVSQLTLFIKQHLEPKFRSVLLQGEISNCTKHSSGHLYFSLKDANAQIGAMMFRAEAARVSPQPKVGDHVIVKGDLSIYAPQGAYKIIVHELYYVGLGALLLKFEQLKQKLQQQGWFAAERKKPLPKFPKRIGVVTSPTGAVIQDMLNILNKRYPGFQLILNPVRVQGEGAAAEIAAAIHFFNQWKCVDVMIIARGGGSLEDLWPFNEEIVAAAIYESHIPIISAVGHETDYSLSDFVADVRAPTPTAAAQMVVPEKAMVIEYLAQSKHRMRHAILQLIRQLAHRVHGLKRHPIFSSPMALLGNYNQRLDDVTQKLDHSMVRYLHKKRLQLTAQAHQAKGLQPGVQLAQVRQRLFNIEKSLNSSMTQRISLLKRQKKNLEQRLNEQWVSKIRMLRKLFDPSSARKKINLSWQQMQKIRNERLQYIIEGLHSVDPRTLLKKGYSILFSEMDDSLIISTHDLQVHQNVRAQLSDGIALLEVKATSTISSQEAESSRSKSSHPKPSLKS